MMAVCYRCGTETQQYDTGYPICIACLNASPAEPAEKIELIPNDVQLRLQHDWTLARPLRSRTLSRRQRLPDLLQELFRFHNGQGFFTGLRNDAISEKFVIERYQIVTPLQCAAEDRRIVL
jgi:hypothetical protein